MIHRVARRIWVVWLAATFLMTGWTLWQRPFVAPLVERSAAEARVALERAVARTVTADWLFPRLDEALAADDTDRVEMLAGLARDHDIPIDAERQARIDALQAANSGMMATVAACGSCAIDIASCRSVQMIGACALPFELSPAGDVAALGRAGTALVTDAEVDKVEAALAAIGLGATVATVATAGSSATVKAGATVLRVARRMDALNPGVLRVLERAATTGATDEIVAVASDFGRLRAATSGAEALMLLRLADDPAELARVARVAEAAGPETRRTFEVLGKARALRLMDRVADLTFIAIGLVTLIVTQVGTLLGLLLRWVVAPLRPQSARRRPVA